jgi:CBS domain-containing protein
VRTSLLSGELVGSGDTQRQDAYWSVGLATVGGVSVRLHFTFLLLLAWLGYELLQAADPWRGALFIVSVVLSLGWHDLGHALGAWFNGTPVGELVMYPFGGIPSFRRQLKPDEELPMALLGPLFSATAVLGLFLYCEMYGPVEPIQEITLRGGNWLEKLMIVNVILAVANLFPVFPMDGGRVLRAALARRLGDAQATNVATALGLGTAMLIGLAALLFQPILLFVAMFTFLGALAEADVFENGVLTEGVPVEEAMMTDFGSLSPGDSLQRACDALLRGSQEDFPVLQDGQLAGYLTRDDLLRGMGRDGRQGYVAGAMRRDVPSVQPSSDLADAMSAMRKEGLVSLPVVDGDRVIGVISSRNIAEYFAVKRQGLRHIGP